MNKIISKESTKLFDKADHKVEVSVEGTKYTFTKTSGTESSISLYLNQIVDIVTIFDQEKGSVDFQNWLAVERQKRVHNKNDYGLAYESQVKNKKGWPLFRVILGFEGEFMIQVYCGAMLVPLKTLRGITSQCKVGV